jgi:hypothetical protein
MTQRSPSVFHLLMSVLLASLFVPACGDGEPCDKDQELVNNSCMYVSDDGGMGGFGGTVEPQEPGADFGVVCTEDTECGGDAPTCAKAPGADDGICSVLGCVSTPESVVCPIGWSCLAFGNVCTKD